MARTLAGKTLFISGGSRGIGLAIALRAARDGANVALLAKTDQPHPKLEGTVHTAAAEIDAAGGTGLAIVGDVREEESVQAAIDATVARFGGIDAVVNNASAINLSKTVDLPMKRFDLMNQINVRGTFLVTKLALPHLQQSDNGHVLTLSPPLNFAPHWMGNNVGYMMAKYAMSLCALGIAEEQREHGVASNALWPRTTIATAAVNNLLGGAEMMATSRTPEIMADAAYAILTRDAASYTGNAAIDDEVLAEEGITDLEQYSVTPGTTQFTPDLFLDA
ncbi:MAG: NAD(P)-dependent oxidoreductase [Solirubrobacteraceae bacterium]|nr:NAD(P)-dependent oxidoreductase [Solirubrobacteraceae bacterium]